MKWLIRQPNTPYSTNSIILYCKENVKKNMTYIYQAFS